MSKRTKWCAQVAVVGLCAFALKFYYSTASPDQLRWILGPTTTLVQLLSGRSFTFESHAGYMSSDHSFLIAASCAGVNFLLTAFLMLALRKLWTRRFEPVSWRVIPLAAVIAYVATLLANTVRIYVALRLQGLSHEITWLTGSQLHRAEGILIYFVFLLLLFALTEQQNGAGFKSLLKNASFPLVIYYLTTLVLPFVNGAYHQGKEYWEHSAFVIIIPVLLMIPIWALFNRSSFNRGRRCT